RIVQGIGTRGMAAVEPRPRLFPDRVPQSSRRGHELVLELSHLSARHPADHRHFRLAHRRRDAADDGGTGTRAAGVKSAGPDSRFSGTAAKITSWIVVGRRAEGAMEMHQIRYFLAVAEELNFTRASEKCNVSQPSLSRAIKLLEEELGGPLFHRERSRTHLTELGRMVRPHLATVYEQSHAVKRLSRDFADSKMPLRLGIMSTISPGEI